MRWRAGKYVLVIFAVLTMTLGCQGLFEDLDDLSGPGESGPNFEFTGVNDVEAQGATFRAAIYDLGGEANFEHGFCWSTERRPQLGDDPCHSLGTVDSTGPFAYTTEELEPGRQYHVRAFLSARGDEFYSEAETFQTPAPAPFDVEAEIDGDGFVQITWDSLSGVDEFEIYRDADSELLGRVDGETRIFVDEGIESGAALPRIENITASSDDPSGVLVTWEEIGGDGGMEITYIYWVKAIYPETESPLSDGADIQVVTEPEIQGYQIQIDGGEWIDVSETQYIDTDAAPPEIIADIDASQGEYLSFVELVFDEEDIESIPGETRQYRVRALGASGQEGPVSEGVEGRRGPDLGLQVLQMAWRAWIEVGEYEYVALLNQYDNYRHYDAPSDGSEVQYELVVHFTGLDEEVVFGPVTGWRGTYEVYSGALAPSFRFWSGDLNSELQYDFEGPPDTGQEFLVHDMVVDEDGTVYAVGVIFDFAGAIGAAWALVSDLTADSPEWTQFPLEDGDGDVEPWGIEYTQMALSGDGGLWVGLTEVRVAHEDEDEDLTDGKESRVRILELNEDGEISSEWNIGENIRLDGLMGRPDGGAFFGVYEREYVPKDNDEEDPWEITNGGRLGSVPWSDFEDTMPLNYAATAVTFDEEGNVFVGSLDGTLFYYSVTFGVETINLPGAGDTYGRVTALAIGGEGNLLVGTEKGLVVSYNYDPGLELNWTHFPYATNDNSSPVVSIHASVWGYYYVGWGDGRIRRINPDGEMDMQSIVNNTLFADNLLFSLVGQSPLFGTFPEAWE